MDMESFNIWKRHLVEYLSDPDLWTGIMISLGKIVFIYIISRLVIKISRKTIEHMMREREKTPIKFDARRTKTIGKLINNFISYAVNFIVILLILNQFGFYLAPLLAGAGVIGLAIGFGAQSLVKDVITGFFIIFEDQFAVGDVIQTGNFKGTVEEIGLRVTKIKGWTGELYIIPNGSIAEVTNFSINNSVAVIDVSVAYEADIQQAIQVIKDKMKSIYRDTADIVKEPEVLGVQRLGTSEVIIRITAECKPNAHIAVARKINEEIKKALDQNGIEIPYPKMITYHRTE